MLAQAHHGNSVSRGQMCESKKAWPVKLGAHYTTLYDHLLSCSYSQLKTYDWLAHTIQLFCWVVHSFDFLQRVHNVTIVRHHNHYVLWFVPSSNNSSTSQSLCALIGGIVPQLSHSGPTVVWRRTLYNNCCVRFIFLIGHTRNLRQKIASCIGAHDTTNCRNLF